MPSRILPEILKHSKQKLINAIVVHVISELCAVKLGENGRLLTGLKYLGTRPTVGDAVLVDYRGNAPIVITYTIPEPETSAVATTSNRGIPLEPSVSQFDHADLLNLQGGLPAEGDTGPEYYHLTQAEHEGLGSGGHIVQEEGVSLTQRAKLNFVGTGVLVEDDEANDATKVTILVGGGDNYILSQEWKPTSDADTTSVVDWVSLPTDMYMTFTTAAAIIKVDAYVSRCQQDTADLNTEYRIVVDGNEIAKTNTGGHEIWHYKSPSWHGVADVTAGEHTVRVQLRTPGGGYETWPNDNSGYQVRRLTIEVFPS